MQSTRPPTELLSLRSATATYLDMLRDVDQWAEVAADVNRIVRPDYARALDDLRDHCHAALTERPPGTYGTPVGVDAALAVLLGLA